MYIRPWDLTYLGSLDINKLEKMVEQTVASGMNKMLPMAAAVFCFIFAVALSAAAGGDAAVVEHTFVVSINMCFFY